MAGGSGAAGSHWKLLNGPARPSARAKPLVGSFENSAREGPPGLKEALPKLPNLDVSNQPRLPIQRLKAYKKQEFSEIIWLQPGTARIGQNGFSGQLPQDRQTSLPNWPSACDFSYDLGPHNIQEIQSNPAFSLIAQRIRMTIAP
jgi:hypothetical protein